MYIIGLPIRESFRELSSMDIPEYLGSVSDPKAGTFRWVLNNPSFLEFLHAGHCVTLQVFGKPGCGKSVLAKYLHTVIEGLLPPTPKVRDSCRLFFACSAADERRSHPKYILGSFIDQMLLDEEMPDFIYSFYKKDCKALNMDKKAKKAFEWRFDTLLKIFVRLTEIRGRQNRRLICIVDGLDECERGAELLELLLSFARIFSKPATGLHKAIVASRLYHDLVIPAGAFLVPTIDLDRADAMDEDLRIYIRTEVTTLLEHRPGYRPHEHLIVENLEKRANKMFLLVKLLIAMLPGMTDSSQYSVKEVLRSLPDTLTEIYEKLWTGILTSHGDRAVTIVAWIVCSSRPFQIDELAIVIALERILGEDVSKFSSLRTALEEYIPADLSGDIIRLFGPLVRVIGSRVELSHLTLKEYLLDHSNPISIPKLTSISEVHYRLAEICARAMDGAVECPRRGSFESVDSVITVIGEHGPLCPEILQYAAESLEMHKAAAEGSGKLPEAKRKNLELRMYRAIEE